MLIHDLSIHRLPGQMVSVSKVTLFRPKNDGKIWSIFFFISPSIWEEFVIWGKNLPFHEVSQKIDSNIKGF